MPLEGIRTRNPSKREAAQTRLKVARSSGSARQTFLS